MAGGRGRSSESHLVHLVSHCQGLRREVVLPAAFPSRCPLTPGWNCGAPSLLTQEDTASKTQLLWEPHNGFTDPGFSHSVSTLSENGKEAEWKRFNFYSGESQRRGSWETCEREETIPPDYRLEEAKVKQAGILFLIYFHSCWIS